MVPMTPRRPTVPWASTLVWGLVGVLVAFGIAGLASIGLFLLAGAAVVLALALATPALRSPAAPGFVVGLSTAPLYLAWLNRDGPGLVCTTTADSVSCADQWSPWPFVAVGLLFAVAGLTLLALTRRRHPGRSSALPAGASEPAPRT
jgi:hypothetical protein